MVAIGWERESETVRAWTSRDGVTWASLPVPPNEFGVIPHQAIGGPPGILVLGIARDDGLQSVQPWRLVGDRWRPVDLASALGINDHASRELSTATEQRAGVRHLDTGVAVHCFGDQPISFRAYSVRCDGCGGGFDATFSPAWLSPGNPQIFLSPMETESGGWLDLALDPSVERHPAGEAPGSTSSATSTTRSRGNVGSWWTVTWSCGTSVASSWSRIAAAGS